MARINLLPWREEARKERKKRFITVTGLSAALMCMLVLAAYVHYEQRIAQQNARNQTLEKEIKDIEDRIQKVETLEQEKAGLLARMKVIEQLQTRRPLVVHLFDELSKSLPDGVYLTSVKQTGAEVVLQGVAQSNARISNFMRTMEASPFLENPRLEVVQADAKNLAKGAMFTLHITQTGYGEDLAEKKDKTAEKDKDKKDKKGSKGKDDAKAKS